MLYSITENISIGDRWDYEENEFDGNTYLCLAAKTFHKMIAQMDGCDDEGYSGNMSPSESEYLIAKRFDRNTLAVNLIDAPDVKYIPTAIIGECLGFISKALKREGKVIVFCDQGMSRSAGIVFMHGISEGWFKNSSSYEEAKMAMTELYPRMQLGLGMDVYIRRFWDNMQERP